MNKKILIFTTSAAILLTIIVIHTAKHFYFSRKQSQRQAFDDGWHYRAAQPDNNHWQEDSLSFERNMREGE